MNNDVSLRGSALVWAVFAISIGIGLSVIDGVIVNIGLPVIAKEFAITPSHSVLAVNAYQIVVAMSLLPFATLGDKIGYRTIYLRGFVLFILSSLFCSIASDFNQLVIARAIQGLGAAAIMCVGTALIRTVYPAEKLGRGVGISAMVVASCTALGPTLASAILAVADWRWFFYINIPLGLLGLFLGNKYLPLNHLNPAPYDTRSALMSAATIGSMLLFVETAGHSQPLWLVIPILIGFVVVGTVFIRRQCALELPLFPVDLIRKRPYALSVVTGLFSFASQMLVLVSMPFFLTNHVGISISAVGLVYTAWPLTIMATAPLAGRASDSIHPGLLGFIGLVLSTVGFGLLANLQPGSSHLDIVWRMALCGLGFGLFQAPNTRFVIGLTPSNRTGSMSGMVGTVRLTGHTIGASLAAIMLHLYADNHGLSALLLAVVLSSIAAFISLARKKY